MWSLVAAGIVEMWFVLMVMSLVVDESAELSKQWKYVVKYGTLFAGTWRGVLLLLMTHGIPVPVFGVQF